MSNRPGAWWTVCVFVCSLLVAGEGFGLVDIPTTEREAYTLAELAASSGASDPVDLVGTPMDSRQFSRLYDGLAPDEPVDPTVFPWLRWEEARRRNGYVTAPAPLFSVRSYYLAEGAGSRVILHASGDTLEEGFNVFGSLRGGVFLGDWLGGGYDLQVRSSAEGVDYRTKRLYLKATWGKWSFKVGRDAERLGPGYHGSLLLDDTAPTMNLWRVRTEEPLYLPGPLSMLGGFRFLVLNGFLDDSAPSPPDPRYGSGVAPTSDPRLFAMRFSYHPVSWLDFGFTRTVMYGGEGREPYDSPSEWLKLFTGADEHGDGGDHTYDNDGYGAYDLTLRLPVLNGVGPLEGGKLYAQSAGADGNLAKFSTYPREDHAFGFLPFKVLSIGRLAGAYLTTGATDLRFEYASTNPAWYRHSQYSQGFSAKGIPLGHHMGGDAWNGFGEVTHRFGSRCTVSLGLDVEKRGKHLSTPERRTEGELAVSFRRLRWGEIGWSVRANVLVSRVRDPLDDLEREDRSEQYVGLELTAAPW